MLDRIFSRNWPCLHGPAGQVVRGYPAANGALVRALVAFGFVALHSLTLARASAETSGEASPGALVLWYRATEGCPSGSEFLALVEKRHAKAGLAKIGDQIDFVVTLGEKDGGFAGRVERQTDRGTAAIREVAAPSCAAVAEALALSLALVAGSESRPDNGAASEDTVSAGPNLQPPVAAAFDGAESNPAESPDLNAMSMPALTVPAGSKLGTGSRLSSAVGLPATESDSPASAKSQPTVSRWTLGLGGVFLAGVGPSPMFGPAAFGAWQLDGPRFWAPGIRLGFARMTGSEPTSRGAIDSALLVGTMDLCPFRLKLAKAGIAPSVTPCVALNVGRLQIEGTGEAGLSASRVWGSGALVSRLGWSLGWFVVELRGAAHLPVTRYNLLFERPRKLVHQMPDFALQTELDLAGQFP